jgi:GNAT superfamily N-acetyltransferase
MFRVENMSKKDFEFAVRITDTIHWGLSDADFEFMLEVEPEGCFVLHEDTERIGIATTISYGRIGWFGNLVVAENHRNEGAGSFLVEYSLEYLKRRKVQTVGLYAYLERIPFYERLGFEYDSDFVFLKGEGSSQQSRPDVILARGQDFDRIIAFDRACLGASRKRLLQPILQYRDNFCFAKVKSDEIVGYVVVKVFEGGAEVGPLVCQPGHAEVAIELLEAVLARLQGVKTSLCIAKRESVILDTLRTAGFAESYNVARMLRGPQTLKECICGAESLERG